MKCLSFEIQQEKNQGLPENNCNLFQLMWAVRRKTDLLMFQMIFLGFCVKG